MRKFVLWTVRIVAIIVIVVCLANLGILGYRYYQARHEYSDLAHQYKIEITPIEEPTQEPAETEESPVDFEGLWQVNPDVVGWITFDGDSIIDYPILQGESNDTYLHRTFYGTENASGSIFLDYQNSGDFSDSHTLIYGHNMKDLSMFGSLKKFQDEEYFQEHPSFTLYTPDDSWKYEIFSCHRVDLSTTDVYTIYTGGSQKFGSFVQSLKDSSIYDTGVEVTQTDHIITLSTCTSSNSSRFVIHAKRVEE